MSWKHSSVDNHYINRVRKKKTEEKSRNATETLSLVLLRILTYYMLFYKCVEIYVASQPAWRSIKKNIAVLFDSSSYKSKKQAAIRSPFSDKKTIDRCFSSVSLLSKT